jgi:hypothetical protein
MAERHGQEHSCGKTATVDLPIYSEETGSACYTHGIEITPGEFTKPGPQNMAERDTTQEKMRMWPWLREFAFTLWPTAPSETLVPD